MLILLEFLFCTGKGRDDLIKPMFTIICECKSQSDLLIIDTIAFCCWYQSVDEKVSLIGWALNYLVLVNEGWPSDPMTNCYVPFIYIPLPHFHHIIEVSTGILCGKIEYADYKNRITKNDSTVYTCTWWLNINVWDLNNSYVWTIMWQGQN